ncbi:MAG: hypothetical protein JWN29_4019 [Acidimicrobiales bacterium]|nr:hypothetical protein [Acidimicrobiales bacterium]
MTRRLPALAVIVSVLALLVVFGTEGHATRTPAFGRVNADVMPAADPAGALSSTWYCAGGTATAGGVANLTVVVANVGASPRTGTVTWIPTGGGKRTVVPLRVGPDRSQAVAATDSVDAPIVSALVELDGGEVAVEHAVSGPHGSAAAPCASEPSNRWYLANGVTERDADETLALFNPFPDDAVVDIAVSSEQGRGAPSQLQGLPIAAGTTTFVRLGDHVRYRKVAAVAVVARTGRLVVDRIQSFDGTAGRSGISLAVAAPAPASTWYFPDGLYEGGLAESWHVYNPGDREAQVTLEIVPAKGNPPEPYDITIPPHTQQTVEATPDRVASGVAHSSTIRSLNGVPVVAERAIDARKPAPRQGWSSALGAPRADRRWVFPIGEANVNTDEWIVIHNPGAQRRTVSVVALANGQRLPIEGLQDLRIGPAGRLALRLGDHISRTPLPVVVEADGPVVAEREAYAVGRLGLSAIIGIPVG